jgi:hypothetical protein
MTAVWPSPGTLRRRPLRSSCWPRDEVVENP